MSAHYTPEQIATGDIVRPQGWDRDAVVIAVQLPKYVWIADTREDYPGLAIPVSFRASEVEVIESREQLRAENARLLEELSERAVCHICRQGESQ